MLKNNDFGYVFIGRGNDGNPIPEKDPHQVNGFHKALTEAEKEKLRSYPESSFFGEPEQTPDTTEKDRDTQNDGGYNEKTGYKNPPGREKNYLRMRSRIGRRR